MALSIAQIIVGWFANSHSLLVDGFHSFSDLLSDLLVLFVARHSVRDADENHPYGHGRAETLATAIVAVMLLGAAVLILVQSVREVLTPHHAPATFKLYVLLGVVFVKARTLVRCNQRYAEIYGFSSPEAAVGRSSLELYRTEAEARELGRRAYPVLAAGETFRVEQLMRRQNGELFWTHLTGRLINPDDPAEGSICRSFTRRHDQLCAMLL
mgnify:CR=1 FL=1